MKKIFTLTLSVLFSITATAQSDGFYRVKNTYTKRYLSIEDIIPANYKVDTHAMSVNVGGLRTSSDWTYVSAAPSTIIYVKGLGGTSFDLQAQGTSIYELSSKKLGITLTPQGDGSYIASGSGTYSGVSVSATLYDNQDLDAYPDECFVSADSKGGKSVARFWNMIPVDTGDNYLGIEANVKTDDGYWGSIFAGFAFDLASDGMTAYYINATSGDGFTLEKISGTIPAATPVIVKCNSNDPSKNKIIPVTNSGSAASGNKLGGVYCSLYEPGHLNVTNYNKSTMRILGSSEGKLAFVIAKEEDLFKGQYLRGNRAYLTVPAGSPAILVEGGTGITTINAQEAKSEGTYSLTGVRIQEGSTPKAGIYIQNGKKVVIK